MTYPRVSHLSDARQIAGAINQALKLGENAGTGGGTGTVTTTGTPASGNLTAFSGATSITNGNLSGDVTTGGTLATTIAAGAVSLAKMANVATGTVFYRKTAGTGAPEVQTLATLKTDLGLTGTNSGDQTITLTGDVTGSGTGSFAATLANSGVTAGTYGDSTHTLTATVDAKGRVTALSTNAISAGAMTLISEVVTSSSQASVTFSTIAATYRDLVVVVRGRGTATAANVNVQLQFNSDTATNYEWSQINFQGSTNFSGGATTAAQIVPGVIPAASASASAAGSVEAVVLDYRGTTFHKSTSSRSGAQAGATGATMFEIVGYGRWKSASAITDVKVFLSSGNFVDGSVVSLYGRM